MARFFCTPGNKICKIAVSFLPFFFPDKTHTPHHIQDGLNTGLALFSSFCPSQSRREVKKLVSERVGWGPLAAVVCQKFTEAGCVLDNLGGCMGIC